MKTHEILTLINLGLLDQNIDDYERMHEYRDIRIDIRNYKDLRNAGLIFVFVCYIISLIAYDVGSILEWARYASYFLPICATAGGGIVVYVSHWGLEKHDFMVSIRELADLFGTRQLIILNGDLEVMKGAARKILCRWGTELRRVKKVHGINSRIHTEYREYFEKKHELFRKFDLAEPTWDPYLSENTAR